MQMKGWALTMAFVMLFSAFLLIYSFNEINKEWLMISSIVLYTIASIAGLVLINFTLESIARFLTAVPQSSIGCLVYLFFLIPIVLFILVAISFIFIFSWLFIFIKIAKSNNK